MFSITIFSVLLVILIGLGLYLKSVPIFEQNSFWQLISSSEWRPGNGQFGFLPFIAGTIAITLIAIVLALPIALLSALFLTEFSKSYLKKWVFFKGLLHSLPTSHKSQNGIGHGKTH